MGDCLGIPAAVDFYSWIEVLVRIVKKYQNDCDNRLRPHYVEYTGSRPITEVKQRLVPVSTWMGDCLGIPGAVDFYFG